MNSSTDIELPWFLATIAAAAIGAVGAGALLMFLMQPNEDPRLIHVGSRDRLARNIPPPFCDPQHHFCISHDSNGNLIALYTYDPHIRERRPCEVAWHADREHEGANGTIVHGTFDDPCGGSVYDITGHRLFGPTPRDLDSFPVSTSNDNSTVVDTRTLICGKQRDVETHDCRRAPADD